jgi:hypothetical protein
MSEQGLQVRSKCGFVLTGPGQYEATECLGKSSEGHIRK